MQTVLAPENQVEGFFSAHTQSLEFSNSDTILPCQNSLDYSDVPFTVSPRG